MAGLCIKSMFFKPGRVFYPSARHVLVTVCSVDISIWAQHFENLFALTLMLKFHISFSSFSFSYRILRSQWDVRSLEAGLTEGAW